jgi:hypothetical protein
MRIWDIPVKKLCRQHLLGEHRELHAIWIIITKNKKGYSQHPETKRWQGKLKLLYQRHQEQTIEMKKRGYRHLSPLDKKFAKGGAVQNIFIDSTKEQKKILKNKKCDCKI